eukprot:g49706.t1
MLDSDDEDSSFESSESSDESSTSGRYCSPVLSSTSDSCSLQDSLKQHSSAAAGAVLVSRSLHYVHPDYLTVEDAVLIPEQQKTSASDENRGWRKAVLAGSAATLAGFSIGLLAIRTVPAFQDVAGSMEFEDVNKARARRVAPRTRQEPPLPLSGQVRWQGWLRPATYC